MIIALFVVILGAVILGSWVQLLATRQRFAESALTGQNRRIALDNARSLARQYALSDMPDGTISSTNFAATNGWGFTVSNAISDLWGNRDPAYFNPASPFGTLRYGTPVTVVLTAIYTNRLDTDVVVTNTTTNIFQIRNRSPLMGGFPLVVHAPSVDPGGVPATNIWQTNFRGLSGFPNIPFTSGGTNSPYAGFLPVLPNPTNVYIPTAAFPTTTNFLTTTNGATTNTVQISLNLVPADPSTNSVVRYDVPNSLTNRFLANGTITTNTNTATTTRSVTRLLLQGAPLGESAKVLHVVVGTNATNLSNIILSGPNTRRVYISVNRSSASSLTLTATNLAGNWRAGITLSKTDLVAAGNPSLVGGLRTDGSISQLISFLPETNAAALDAVADRVMWLEDFRQP